MPQRDVQQLLELLVDDVREVKGEVKEMRSEFRTETKELRQDTAKLNVSVAQLKVKSSVWWAALAGLVPALGAVTWILLRGP
ncbi:MAG: hypothetical protein AMJ46_12680 [Latescibacteria bacterium DG_63]|nr:MAG: hypothetical protein AMJ46_12680 [Latescibacteria bacterium DG_63]